MRSKEKKSFKKIAILITMIIVFVGAAIFAVNKFSSKKTVATDKKQKVPILLYHHMLTKDEKQANSNAKKSDMIVTSEQFEEQMKYLSEQNYHTLTLKEFEDFMSGKASIPEKSVLITFDDGLKTNYTHAYPILKKYKQHATAFLITAKLADKEEALDSTKLQRISKKNMEEMKDVFDYGSHTDDMHKKVKNVAKIIEGSKDEVKKDFEKSENLLHTNAFAYPFGKYNSTDLEILKELDFKFAFTIESKYATQESKSLEIGRFGMFPYTSQKQFIQIVSGKYEKTK
ncbi:transcriptional regulator [Bacillus cereus]|uniref:polysaccharide deacetylase family protein n=1 Tax=Bacillus cereus TaxID=1396 RepID=UPI000BFAA58C|nr:polysaccharide deacetylase family protein [Bacillus cereus]PFL18624.1 transcriptional regulator [Bacillus cereus]